MPLNYETKTPANSSVFKYFVPMKVCI